MAENVAAATTMAMPAHPPKRTSQSGRDPRRAQRADRERSAERQLPSACERREVRSGREARSCRGSTSRARRSSATTMHEQPPHARFGIALADASRARRGREQIQIAPTREPPATRGRTAPRRPATSNAVPATVAAPARSNPFLDARSGCWRRTATPRSYPRQPVSRERSSRADRRRSSSRRASASRPAVCAGPGASRSRRAKRATR